MPCRLTVPCASAPGDEECDIFAGSMQGSVLLLTTNTESARSPPTRLMRVRGDVSSCLGDGAAIKTFHDPGQKEMTLAGVQSAPHGSRGRAVRVRECGVSTSPLQPRAKMRTLSQH